MRLTAFLMLCLCLQVSARGLSQKITFSAQNVPLENVFKVVREQSGYLISYNASILKTAKPVSVSVKDYPLEDFIKLILSDQHLRYVLKDKSVMIYSDTNTKSQKPHFNIGYDSPPVTGIITDKQGNPLQGINITVRGTKSGVVSNEKGEFALNADPEAILIISSVEYETKEVRASSLKADRNIGLVKKVSPLDEVHILGYGTTTKRYSVGAIAKVSAEEIEMQPVTNPLQALEGRVAGLTVNQSSGVPGASFMVQVRGQNSLSPNARNVLFDNPLFIIDGVPFAPQNSTVSQYSSLSSVSSVTTGNRGMSPFNSINPADIESVEVLKDADATAIYGSRGANGVVLITTKRGKPGKGVFKGNVNTGGSKVTRVMPLMNTKQYLEMRHEALQNDGLVPSTDPYDPGYAPDLLVFDTTRYTDWSKFFTGGTAHATDANMSYSGGESNTLFFLGAGYHHESYIYPGDFGDSRASFNSNIHHVSNDKKLSIDFSANYSYDQNNSSGEASILQVYTLPPNFPALMNADGSLNWTYKDINLKNAAPNGANPLAYLKHQYSIRNYNLITDLFISYRLFKGFTLSSRFGYNTFIANENQGTPASMQDPSEYPVASAHFGTNNFRTWNIEPQAEYKKSVANGVLTILAGGTFQKNTNSSTDISASNYTNDLLIGSVSAAGTKNAADAYSLYKYNGVFGRINYIWKNRYIVNLSGRRDGSSKFGPGNQFGNFGSAGLGWIFSETQFIKNNLPALSFGKLRVSYGSAGNDNIANYQYFAAYAPNLNLPYQGMVGYNPQNLYNPDYHWALTKKAEIGLEWGLWNDRLVGEFSWYENRSSNQLVAYTLPSQSGFTRVTQNAPYTVQNKGFEFQVTSTNIRTRNFRWNTTANLSIPRNKLISFPNIAGSPYANIYMVGKSVTVLKKVHFTGVNDTTGLFTFQDVDHDGRIFYTTDGRAIGDLDPKFFGGIGNSFNYKGFQLYFFAQFVKQFGPNYLQQIYNFGYPVGYQVNQPAALLSNWKQPGDHAAIQKFSTQYDAAYSTGANFGLSDGAYSDASFIRIKTISLTYSLPVRYLKSIKMKGCDISINAQNLFTITKYKGNDPETQEFYSLPPLKTITAGLKFIF